MSLIALLAHHIRQHGPIRTARVSSAQARGAAKKYAYRGAVRYEIRLSADGRVINVACERASSDRRSERLVEEDCAALCEREGRIRCQTIGHIRENDAAEYLPASYQAAIDRHVRRRDTSPRPLALAERLLVHLALRCGHYRADAPREAVERDVRDGRLTRRGRWLSIRSREWSHGTDYYLPLGDERDAAAFAAEKNQERRRKIIQACGERVIPEATRELLQQDDYGQLWRITSWDGRQERQVRVVCPSTSSVYWLPVDWRAKTAHEAVAQTFGLPAEEYQPAAQA